MLDCGFVLYDAPDTRLTEHDATIGVERDEIAPKEAHPAEIGRVDDGELACFRIPRNALEVTANGMNAKR